MSDNKNKGDEVRPKVQWTAEDRARHRAIRDMFRNWHPSPEELIATGEAANFDLHGEYRELRPFVEEIKRAREAAGLTVAEVSRRCAAGKRDGSDIVKLGGPADVRAIFNRARHFDFGPPFAGDPRDDRPTLVPKAAVERQ